MLSLPILRRRDAAAALLALPLAVAVRAAPLLRIVAAAPPGSGVDRLLRRLAALVGERIGARAMVDNRPGGGGLVAARALARAAPDGATWGLLNQGHATLQAMGAPLDLLRGFAPVGRIGNAPCAFAVAPQAAAHTLADLARTARAAATPLAYGCGGAGSASQLSAELWSAAAGLRLVAIPFKGLHDSLPSLLAGELAFVAGVLPTLLPLAASSGLRLLAVSTRERVAVAPEVPSIAEAGRPDAVYDSWSGLFAPRGTPAARIDAMALALRAAMDDAGFAAAAQAQGIALAPSAMPQAFAAEIAASLAQERTLVARLGLRYMP